MKPIYLCSLFNFSSYESIIQSVYILIGLFEYEPPIRTELMIGSCRFKCCCQHYYHDHQLHRFHENSQVMSVRTFEKKRFLDDFAIEAWAASHSPAAVAYGRPRFVVRTCHKTPAFTSTALRWPGFGRAVRHQISAHIAMKEASALSMRSRSSRHDGHAVWVPHPSTDRQAESKQHLAHLVRVIIVAILVQIALRSFHVRPLSFSIFLPDRSLSGPVPCSFVRSFAACPTSRVERVNQILNRAMICIRPKFKKSKSWPSPKSKL